MTIEFVFRIVGMIVFAIMGVSFGVATADAVNLPPDANGLIFSLVGALAGLVMTPWITTRPAKSVRSFLLQSPTEVLLTSLFGLIFGLLVAVLVAWPFSRLPGWLGQYVPSIMALVSAYFSIVLFSARAYDIFSLFKTLIRGELDSVAITSYGTIGVLLDTSVIIDGRVLDISKAGFIQGVVLVPQFILSELHNIANSSEPMRRQRGRHGIETLNRLKQEGQNVVQIIDDDPDGVDAVDAKLVEVAKARDVALMTNDFNLNGVAEVHGVTVLNLNELSLALQPNLLPGEEILLQINAEGRESDQGVGYLEDGTMVVVENGRRYLDRRVEVLITRYIRSSAGKMYFAVPSNEA